MPGCVYPVIFFDSVYDESNALGRMMALREQSEPTDVISDESEHKVYNMDGSEASQSYALTSDSGNFYFKENGTNLDLMATNADLNKAGSQEISIFKLNSAAGTPVSGVNELGSLTVIYNGINWVFGTIEQKLYFLYRIGGQVFNVAIFDATNGQPDTSELAEPDLQVKYTTLETSKWRIKGVTNGVTYSSSNTNIVFEYSSDLGANWVAAAKLSATL